MNVARLNLTHGDHVWHAAVMDRIRQLNQKRGYSVAIMVDTEGEAGAAMWPGHTAGLGAQLSCAEQWSFVMTALIASIKNHAT